MRRHLVLGPALLAMAVAALPARAAPSSGTSGMPACDVCTAQMTGTAQEQAAAKAGEIDGRCRVAVARLNQRLGAIFGTDRDAHRPRPQ